MHGFVKGIMILLIVLLGFSSWGIPVDWNAEDQIEDQCFVQADYGGPPIPFLDGGINYEGLPGIESDVELAIRLNDFQISGSLLISGTGSILRTSDPADEIMSGYMLESMSGTMHNVNSFYVHQPEDYKYIEDFVNSAPGIVKRC